MPLTLAIEWSTRRLSVATRLDNCGPTESCLMVDRFHGPAAIGLLEDHLADQNLRLDQLSEIVIGRGPGNFSGIRLAFAWSAGCMAPGNITLKAFSSGHGMAERLLRDRTECYILGDARRGQWWGCPVSRQHLGDWELHTPDSWRKRIGQDQTFSAEASRLDGVPNLHEAFPHATDLLQTQLEPENTDPLYLHPAV